MHPLDGPRFKLKRAKVHLRTIEHNLGAYYGLKPYSLVKDIQPDQSFDIIRVKISRPAPDRLGVFIGEFAFDLRSALDQLAWALASRGGKTSADGTVFPIWDTKPITDKARSVWRSQAEGIGKPDSDEIRLIERLQPYNRGDLAHQDPLFVLNDIGNADKHRYIAVAGHFMRIVFPPMPLLGLMQVTQMFNDGDEVLVVGKAVDPKYQLNPIQTAYVTFHVGKTGYPVSVPFLNSLYEYVRDEVIPGFTRFFETPENSVMARPVHRPPPMGSWGLPPTRRK